MTGAGRRRRLADAQLYLCVGIRSDLEGFLEAVLDAGVDVVQLRDKEATAVEQMRAGEVFRKVCERYGALFVVNDRADLAIACGADGVHLGQEDLQPSEARAIVGEEMLVGRSTHAPEELRRSLEEPVDYLGVGPVAPTPTKPGRPGVGFESVRLAAAEATLPWFATGGMNAGTIPAAAAAGARRFVVVRAITEARDPAAAVRRLRDALPPS